MSRNSHRLGVSPPGDNTLGVDGSPSNRPGGDPENKAWDPNSIGQAWKAPTADREPAPVTKDHNYIPWRGSQDHGVALQGLDVTDPMEAYGIPHEGINLANQILPDMDIHNVREHEVDANPVDVRVISTVPDGETRKSFATNGFTLTTANVPIGTYLNIAPHRDDRSKVTIYVQPVGTATSSDVVIVAANQSVPVSQGFPLSSGGMNSTSITTQDDVWVTLGSNANGGAIVYVLVEYEVTLPVEVKKQ